MVISYLRIKVNLKGALARFKAWVAFPEVEPPKEISYDKMADEILKDENVVVDIAVSIYEIDGWTVFDDLIGSLSRVTASEWLKLAGDDDLVFAGYNDSIHCGQLISIHDGAIQRNFLDNKQHANKNVDNGRLPFEEQSPIRDWIDAAAYVDDDPFFMYPKIALLWKFNKNSRVDS